MHLTTEEMKMVNWLRKQHAAWRGVRTITLVSSILVDRVEASGRNPTRDCK